jgi:peptidase E
MLDSTSTGSGQPKNTALHLVSSLDSTTDQLTRIMTEGGVHNIHLIETARLAEGRSYAPDEKWPFQHSGFSVAKCCALTEPHDSLEALMRSADACLLLGGNTFALMQTLEDVGFDDMVRRRVASPDPFPFHIVGESAGAVAMGISITHVASMDDPTQPTRRTDNGLGWIDARVLPHRGCPHWGFGEAVEKVIQDDTDPDSLLILDEDELRSFVAA